MGASIGRCTLVCRPRELGGDGQCTQMARWGVLDGTHEHGEETRPAVVPAHRCLGGLYWPSWLVMPGNQMKVWECNSDLGARCGPRRALQPAHVLMPPWKFHAWSAVGSLPVAVRSGSGSLGVGYVK